MFSLVHSNFEGSDQCIKNTSTFIPHQRKQYSTGLYGAFFAGKYCSEHCRKYYTIARQCSLPSYPHEPQKKQHFTSFVDYKFNSQHPEFKRPITI